MQLNIEKCVVLRCTRSSFSITLDYISDDKTFKVVKQYEYQGIILHESKWWLHHIQAIYYIKLKSRLSVRPSCLSRLYLGISAWIDIRFASNEATIFWDLKSLFLKVSKSFRLPSVEL